MHCVRFCISLQSYFVPDGLSGAIEHLKIAVSCKLLQSQFVDPGEHPCDVTVFTHEKTESVGHISVTPVTVTVHFEFGQTTLGSGKNGSKASWIAVSLIVSLQNHFPVCLSSVHDDAVIAVETLALCASKIIELPPVPPPLLTH
jgi:hypothetical protein